MQKCPECSKKFSVAPEMWPRVLGRHLQAVHKITGKSDSATKNRLKRKTDGKPLAPTGVSLHEAIAVLEAQIHARQEVIETLKALERKQ